MRLAWLTMITAAALGLASACGGNGKDVAVPRQVAYPRIALLPDTSYISAPDGTPLYFEVNSHAVSETATGKGDGSTWLTVRYPSYGATMYCTFMSVDANTRGDVIDNRTERMMLNLNGAAHTDTMLTTPSGFEALVVRSPQAVSTPLQFLADDGKDWIVSGSVFFAQPPSAEATDSVAPIVDALMRDLVHGLNSLGK